MSSQPQCLREELRAMPFSAWAKSLGLLQTLHTRPLLFELSLKTLLLGPATAFWYFSAMVSSFPSSMTSSIEISTSFASISSIEWGLNSLLIKLLCALFRCKRALSIERKARKRREIDKFINYRITGNSESIIGSVIRTQLPVITGNGNYRLKP